MKMKRLKTSVQVENNQPTPMSSQHKNTDRIP